MFHFSKKAWGEKLWSEPKRDDFSERFPSFCRLRFATQDGVEIAFTDPRRFGRIRLTEDPAQDPALSKLGFDPLVSPVSLAELVKVLSKRKAPLKAVLLDQGVFAGVGNWIADEVLFQAKLSPHRLANSLSKPEVTRLRTKLFSIVERAVGLHADYDRYPKTWLFHHRWGKDSEAKTSKGAKIVHDTIGGRTTAWVPSIQK
ncbi:MAG: hypothetical protein EOP09_15530 [Proteobacteria bacterium]|nr:MAG: hypothetical protein EOP09_15530 [Pseudomonadota bacterium]